MILFDFRAPPVNSFNRKRRHIGIRIIIRIIYYPINRYPDSKLSVLSIPTNEDKQREACCHLANMIEERCCLSS